MREERTDVVVVGAGPVGLWTAVLLAEAGVKVKIVDREARTAARSYACALHPHTLKLLQRFALAGPVLELGRRIQTIAFYDGASRKAEVKMSEAGGDFPFLLTLPQDALERVLEERLSRAGVAVNWNCRFDALRCEGETVVAEVDRLGGTATGYVVPHWDTVVKERVGLSGRFLIGADGQNSLVRQRLGIESERVTEPEFFAAYEFESEDQGGDEVRVVLDDSTANVLWPLPNGKCRWTFQLVRSEVSDEFPEKERRAVRFAQETVDDKIRRYVQKVAGHRAPWFSADVKKITWCTEVAFAHRMVRQFGRDRCWLVGDAAHQTGPVGVQSMNAGFCEAEALAGSLARILREKAPLDTLNAYERERQAQWRRLLGLTGGLRPRDAATPWVRQRCARILPCLPATNEDLVRLANQLNLDLA